MDASGKREELRHGTAACTVGYYVVLPNLYYRNVTLFDYTTESRLHVRVDEHIERRSNRRRYRGDVRSYDIDPAADSGRWLCRLLHERAVSFAMAGMFLGAEAAASLYGVRLFGEGSPAHLAERVKGELYFGCAEFDDYAPKEMIDGLEAHLGAVGANARVEWYPGVHHGFGFPQRPAYDKPAAERHWERLFSLFARNLAAT
jgi:carboxymethylenebutenolidase